MSNAVTKIHKKGYDEGYKSGYKAAENAQNKLSPSYTEKVVEMAENWMYENPNNLCFICNRNHHHDNPDPTCHLKLLKDQLGD